MQADRFAQTSLFYGIEGVGKKRVAFDLVRQAFCDKGGKDCGTCQSCEMIAKGAHPDLFLVTPQPPASQTKGKEEGSNWTIKVEQVQELKKKLVHYPLMADYQIVIIDGAEKLTTTTANALLKILEEPKKNCLFILLTSSLNKVLPTIRSRAAKYHFSKLTEAHVRELVKAVEPDLYPSAEDFSFYYRAFNGSVGSMCKAIRAELSLKDLQTLTGGKKDFIAVTERVRELLSAEIDPALLLQVLRQQALENELEEASDLQVFDRLSLAELQLSRHIQKDLIFECLLI